MVKCQPLHPPTCHSHFLSYKIVGCFCCFICLRKELRATLRHSFFAQKHGACLCQCYTLSCGLLYQPSEVFRLALDTDRYLTGKLTTRNQRSRFWLSMLFCQYLGAWEAEPEQSGKEVVAAVESPRMVTVYPQVLSFISVPYLVYFCLARFVFPCYRIKFSFPKEVILSLHSSEALRWPHLLLCIQTTLLTQLCCFWELWVQWCKCFPASTRRRFWQHRRSFTLCGKDRGLAHTSQMLPILCTVWLSQQLAVFLLVCGYVCAAS